MNTMLTSAGAAPPATPKRRAASPAHSTAAARRLNSLAEIVRDLAGWTLPGHRREASPQPEGWQLA